MVTVSQATKASEVVETELAEALGPKLPGIVGLAVAWDERGELCVRVDVEPKAAAAAAAALPKEVNGVPVKVSPMQQTSVELE